MIKKNRAAAGMLTGLFIGFMTLGGTAFAQETDTAKSADPKADAAVAKLAFAVTIAAHPTAKNVGLLKYSRTKRDGLILVKMNVEYSGAFSKNRYTADSLVEMQSPKSDTDPAVFTNIDFIDRNNSTRPNKKNLKRLIEDLNARERMAKAN
jgi:hypothetical protein